MVTITSEMHSVPGSANEGTFHVAGTDLICADGLVFDFAYVIGGDQGGQVREILVTKAFVCSDEDGFIVRMQVHQNLVLGTERFTWVILHGVGAFEGLNGRGDGTTESANPATGPWFNTYNGFLID